MHGLAGSGVGVAAEAWLNTRRILAAHSRATGTKRVCMW
jgi:hypothetical protein